MIVRTASSRRLRVRSRDHRKLDVLAFDSGRSQFERSENEKVQPNVLSPLRRYCVADLCFWKVNLQT